MVICKICNKELKSVNSLSQHIRKHNIDGKSYYDNYILKEENKCQVCSKETKFINLSKGYRSTCSMYCNVHNPLRAQKIRETKLNKSEEYKAITRERRRQTNLKKYGVINISQLKSTTDKVKETIKEKYGEHRELLTQISGQTNKDGHNKKYIELFEKRLDWIKDSLKDLSVYQIAKELKVPINRLKKFLKQSKIEIILNRKKFDKEQYSQSKKEQYLQSKRGKEEIEKKRIRELSYLECKICNKKIKNSTKVQTHVKKYHKNDMSYQEYYDKFILENKNDKICICGKDKPFNETYGYRKYCSRECSGKDINRISKLKLTFANRSEEQKELSNIKSKETRDKKFKEQYPEIYEKVNNKEWLEEQLKTKNCYEIAKLFNFEIGKDLIFSRIKSFNIEYKKKSISSQENEIYYFLNEELKISNIERNKRNIITPLELDLYLPEYNLAIELDGVYWHSEQWGKHSNYHKTKTEECLKNNIDLLHIFDTEWVNKQDICKSIIRSKLGKIENKIFARKCKVKEVTYKDSNIFLECNHLQGKVSSSIRLGLFYNEELVCLLTIGKSRYNKKFEYEILRYCNKINTTVIGGFGKLYSYFLNTYKPNSIITYADRRYSNGYLYDNFFELSHITNPNYFYFIEGELRSRIMYQKHKLKDKLEQFDKDKTEYENMLINGYDRVWDCGNLVYTKTYNIDSINI